MTGTDKKNARYSRIYGQLEPLMQKTIDPVSRMATIAALLHYKMSDFFWTGFYLLRNDNSLLVGPYQGALACLSLPAGKGVCWAGLLEKKTIIVPDVHKFPGHIACNSRSCSEIVVPLFDKYGEVKGIMDVDSDKYDAFDNTDAEWLEKIVLFLKESL